MKIQKWLMIVLIIVGLDYTLIGFSILFGFISNEIVTPGFGQLQISIGILCFIFATNVGSFKLPIWGIVFQEFSFVILGIYNLAQEITIFSEEGPVVIVHAVYLLILAILNYLNKQEE